MAKPHVELVHELLEELTETGIVSSRQNPENDEKARDPNAPKKHREVDVIIYATGFNWEADSMEQTKRTIKLTGLCLV